MAKRGNKNSNLITSIIAVIILAAVFITLAYFLSTSQKKNTIMLDSKEIKEYQGERLSSINDFRENSIKGVQYVDINNYKLKVTGLVEEEKEYSYEEVVDKITALTAAVGKEDDKKLVSRLMDLVEEYKPMNDKYKD